MADGTILKPDPFYIKQDVSRAGPNTSPDFDPSVDPANGGADGLRAGLPVAGYARWATLRGDGQGRCLLAELLDLSYGAALKLDFLGQGTTRVKIEVIEVGNDEYMKHVPEP